MTETLSEKKWGLTVGRKAINHHWECDTCQKPDSENKRVYYSFWGPMVVRQQLPTPTQLALSVIMVPITGLLHLMIDWCGKNIIDPSVLDKTIKQNWLVIFSELPLSSSKLCFMLSFPKRILFALISLLIFYGISESTLVFFYYWTIFALRKCVW